MPTTGNISPSPNPADSVQTVAGVPPLTNFDNTMLASATVTSTAGTTPTAAATATSTTPTDSAAHMSSYGGALTSPAYGASSLGAYSAYPYGSLVSNIFSLLNSNFDFLPNEIAISPSF